MARAKKTVEEKKATKRAWLERRREWIRNEFRESIDNYDKERFDKTIYYCLDYDYLPKREWRKYYKEFIVKWHDRMLAENPLAQEILNNLKIVIYL